jgi:hypothetical protein
MALQSVPKSMKVGHTWSRDPRRRGENKRRDLGMGIPDLDRSGRDRRLERRKRLETTEQITFSGGKSLRGMAEESMWHPVAWGEGEDGVGGGGIGEEEAGAAFAGGSES